MSSHVFICFPPCPPWFLIYFSVKLSNISNVSHYLPCYLPGYFHCPPGLSIILHVLHCLPLFPMLSLMIPPGSLWFPVFLPIDPDDDRDYFCFSLSFLLSSPGFSPVLPCSSYCPHWWFHISSLLIPVLLIILSVLLMFPLWSPCSSHCPPWFLMLVMSSPWFLLSILMMIVIKSGLSCFSLSFQGFPPWSSCSSQVSSLVPPWSPMLSSLLIMSLMFPPCWSWWWSWLNLSNDVLPCYHLLADDVFCLFYFFDLIIVVDCWLFLS